MPNQPTTPPFGEYITLVALLISMTALGTDLMLPAMDVITIELGAKHINDAHFIVTAFFLGMAGGQFLVGPLSDRFGRKPIILIGFVVFFIGCVLSSVAENWAAMLVGRVIQGLGASAPRIVTMALVRDRFEGREMAKFLSIVMSIFITVPVIAPALGLGLIIIGGWRATFIGLAALSLILSVWFFIRMPETLAPSNKRSLRLTDILNGLLEIVRSRIAFGYAITAGLVFGPFIGYLGSSQKIFQQTFLVGDLFVMYFAIAALSLGAASLINAKLVMRLGMRKLSGFALVSVSILSILFWILLLKYEGIPPLSVFLIWLLLSFFFVGLLFGNMNALALEPLGHIAGLGSAFVGSISLLISLPLAWLIGQQYDGTVYPLVAGFAVLSVMAYGVFFWTGKGRALGK